MTFLSRSGYKELPGVVCGRVHAAKDPAPGGPPALLSCGLPPVKDGAGPCGRHEFWCSDATVESSPIVSPGAAGAHHRPPARPAGTYATTGLFYTSGHRHKQ